MYKLTQSKILIALLTLSLLFVCFIGCGEDADENGEEGSHEGVCRRPNVLAVEGGGSRGKGRREANPAKL